MKREAGRGGRRAQKTGARGLEFGQDCILAPRIPGPGFCVPRRQAGRSGEVITQMLTGAAFALSKFIELMADTRVVEGRCMIASQVVKSNRRSPA